MPRLTTSERFWAKVGLFGNEGGCWLWSASTNKGYGVFWDPTEGRTVGAHVYAYRLLVGPIPEGMELDHLCRVRACVNPAHLEPVTSKTNTLRGESPSAINARKTECPQGHPYDEENTYVNPTSGKRLCRTCQRQHDRKRSGLRNA